MSAHQAFWQDLFDPASAGQPGLPVALRLIQKQGRPFLLLPARARSAEATLTLYPAQARRARLAKTLLRYLLRLGLPFGMTRLNLTLLPAGSFVRFLCRLGVADQGGLPEFGVLAGNPAGDGQRLLVLLFNAEQRPVRVVKVGLSPRAQSLVEQEAAFLAAAAGRAGIPALRASAEAPQWRALVLDYFEGDSPGAEQVDGLPLVLGAWVDSRRQIALGTVPEWQRLECVPAAATEWLRLDALRDRPVSVTLQHGDFAPWNIKVSANGQWQVLDWERGAVPGVPGWDWFHYVIQTGILVERQTVTDLVGRVESLLGGEPFLNYAREAGIAGIERQLVLAYLVHCVEIIQPAEGFDTVRALLGALRQRWA